MILSFKLKLNILLQKKGGNQKKKKKKKARKKRNKTKKKRKKKRDFLDGILFLYVVPSVFWFHCIEMVSTPSQAPFP